MREHEGPLPVEEEKEEEEGGKGKKGKKAKASPEKKVSHSHALARGCKGRTDG